MVQKTRFLKLCKVKRKIFPESNRRKQIHGPHSYTDYVKVNKKPCSLYDGQINGCLYTQEHHMDMQKTKLLHAAMHTHSMKTSATHS